MCALAADSAAYCWGNNGSGQLGNGTTADTALPVAVSGGLKFKLLTLGFDHSCGVTAAGDAYCWGDNTWGQLGETTTGQALEPAEIQAMGAAGILPKPFDVNDLLEIVANFTECIEED